jgi:hypothetical protein
VEGERETRFLERSLLDAGVGGAKVKAIGLLRKLAGVAVRGTDVFNKKGIMGAAKGIVKRQIQGVQGLRCVRICTFVLVTFTCLDLRQAADPRRPGLQVLRA